MLAWGQPQYPCPRRAARLHHCPGMAAGVPAPFLRPRTSTPLQRDLVRAQARRPRQLAVASFARLIQVHTARPDARAGMPTDLAGSAAEASDHQDQDSRRAEYRVLVGILLDPIQVRMHADRRISRLSPPLSSTRSVAGSPGCPGSCGVPAGGNRRRLTPVPRVPSVMPGTCGHLPAWGKAPAVRAGSHAGSHERCRPDDPSASAMPGTRCHDRGHTSRREAWRMRPYVAAASRAASRAHDNARRGRQLGSGLGLPGRRRGSARAACAGQAPP